MQKEALTQEANSESTLGFQGASEEMEYSNFSIEFYIDPRDLVVHEQESEHDLPLDAHGFVDLEQLNLAQNIQDFIVRVDSRVTSGAFESALGAAAYAMSGLGSLLSSLCVACGAHGLSAVSAASQVGTGLGSASGIGGLGGFGFNTDGFGNFSLSGNLDALSGRTGISKADLLSGKFSADDIMVAFLSAFGEGMSLIFGFRLITGLIDAMFNSFLPDSSAEYAT